MTNHMQLSCLFKLSQIGNIEFVMEAICMKLRSIETINHFGARLFLCVFCLLRHREPIGDLVIGLLADALVLVLEKHVVDWRQPDAGPQDVLDARPLAEQGVHERRTLRH